MFFSKHAEQKAKYDKTTCKIKRKLLDTCRQLEIISKAAKNI